MSGEVRLSEAAWELLAGQVEMMLSDPDGRDVETETDALVGHVEAILTAHLAPVEALAEEWVTRRHTGAAPSAYAEEVFAALAPQPAPEAGA